MIEVQGLKRDFYVHRKKQGLRASFKALFVRDKIKIPALQDINLQVKEGEILGLVGENGAGKTTLVKILAGIIPPSSGTASVLEQTPFKRKRIFQKQIGLIMGQKAQLWWDLPAADCFELLREIYQIERNRFKTHLQDLAKALYVSDKLDIQLRRLSLGERMKMELIASLLHEPKILFLDEPTIGLDLISQRAIRRFLLEYRQKHRVAMILTSHYMQDIDSLCERIVILNRGRLIYDGNKDALLQQHADYKIIRALGIKPIGNEHFYLPDYMGSSIHGNGDKRDCLIYRVHKNEVSSAIRLLLQAFDVSDLKVEEEALADVIERIQKRDHPD